MHVRFKARLNNQLGMSLIEGLISVGAVAGLAGLVATLTTQVDTNVYALQRSCESLAQSILESVADEGIYSNLYSVAPGFAAITDGASGDTVLTTAQGGSLFSGGTDIDFVDNADLWPSGITLVGSGPRPIINTHRLIKGNMRALNAMYNGPIDLCNDGPVAYPQMTETTATEMANLGLSSELFNLAAAPVVTIQLETVDENGLANCEPTPFEIIPSNQGANARPAAWDPASFTVIDGGGTTLGFATPPPQVRSDLGYKLTVAIEYDIGNDGALENCNSSKTFRYPIDDTPPQMPDTVTITSWTPVRPVQETDLAAADPNFLCESPGANDTLRSLTVRVGYSSGREPGVILLCRDTSQYLDRDVDGGVLDVTGRVYNVPDYTIGLGGSTIPADLVNRTCQIAAGPAPASRYTINPNSDNLPESTAVFRDAESPAEWTGFRFGYLNPNMLDRWVPCHELRVCGRQDSTGGSVTVVAPAAWDSQDDSYLVEMTYTDIPTDCIVGVDVVAVDPSGNFSAINTLVDQFGKSGPYINLPGLGGSDDLNTLDAQSSNRIFHRSLCAQQTPLQSSGQENLGTHGLTGPVKTNGIFVPGVGYWCRPPGWRPTTMNAEATAVLALTGTMATTAPVFYSDETINGPVPADIYTTPAGQVSTSEARQWNWSNVPGPGEDAAIFSDGGGTWNSGSWPPGVPPSEWGNTLNESSDDGTTGGNGNFTWIDEFPNGYYTCRPTGCCVNAPGDNDCTPFSF